jgi:hypothetical protein
MDEFTIDICALASPAIGSDSTHSTFSSQKRSVMNAI